MLPIFFDSLILCPNPSDEFLLLSILGLIYFNLTDTLSMFDDRNGVVITAASSMSNSQIVGVNSVACSMFGYSQV